MQKENEPLGHSVNQSGNRPHDACVGSASASSAGSLLNPKSRGSDSHQSPHHTSTPQSSSNAILTAEEQQHAVEYGSTLLQMQREAQRHEERRRSVEQVLGLVQQMQRSLTTASAAEGRELEARDAMHTVSSMLPQSSLRMQ